MCKIQGPAGSKRLLLQCSLLAITVLRVGQCISLDRCDSVSREDLLKLDREVSRFYYDTYEQVYDKNTSYNDQLFTAIRAMRHTHALHQFDFTYSDERRMRDSVGKQVNLEQCLHHLAILNEFARQAASYHRTGKESFIPLSAIDMLEANGRPESGILNGNFIWLGSASSCQHARIASKYFADALPSSNSSLDIEGRYCVSHLRAKDWPKEDLYFGDRITLRSGLCVPHACHTSLYFDSQQVREQVESLTKSNMLAPFNSDQFEVSYLYCLPDEDSPHRQWDLGVKMFLAFVCIWSMLLLYSNIKYQRRLKAMKMLGKSIDIRMIVEQETQEIPAEQCKASKRTLRPQARGDDRGDTNAPSSRNYDVNESDERQSLGEKQASMNQRSVRKIDYQSYLPKDSDTFDFVKAFAVKANIDYLFRRADFINSKRLQQNYISTIRQVSQQQQQQPSSPASRRCSASNVALIRDLEKESRDNLAGESSDGSAPGVDDQASRARDQRRIEQQQAGRTDDALAKTKRVNIDVLDGIKVFATAYIVYAHTLMSFFGALTDLRYVPERMMDFTTIASINGLQVVGLFYIITGLLISYLAFSRQKSRHLLKPSLWLIAVIGRYLRLLPNYLLVFWFAKHVAPFTGSGPFWLEYRTDVQHPRGYCSHESWLTMLTMSAADIKIPYDCVPQTWYLSNDFRTLFVIPFYIIILALNTYAGYTVILSTILFSICKMTTVLREANIDYTILLHWQPHTFNMLADRLHDVYTNLSIRLSTYLLGVIVGHILYLYETGQIKRMPRWFKRFGLKIALIVGSASFMGAPLISSGSVNQFLPSPDQIDSDTVVILMPFLKTTMELCICVTLLSLTTGGGFKWLTELLSSQPARVLSNISYGVFLIHIEVIYKTPIWKYETSYYYLFLYSSFYILLSNAIAFCVHVFYEMPINNVLRYIFKRIFNSIVK